MGHTTCLAMKLVLILVASVSAAPTSDKCCSEKKVGDILYTLAETDVDDTAKFGCKDGCVYKAEEDPVDKFCFKDGVLPVTFLMVESMSSTGVMREPVVLTAGVMSSRFVMGSPSHL